MNPDFIFKAYEGSPITIQFDLKLREWDIQGRWIDWTWPEHGYTIFVLFEIRLLHGLQPGDAPNQAAQISGRGTNLMAQAIIPSQEDIGVTIVRVLILPEVM